MALQEQDIEHIVVQADAGTVDHQEDLDKVDFEDHQEHHIDRIDLAEVDHKSGSQADSSDSVEGILDSVDKLAVDTLVAVEHFAVVAVVDLLGLVLVLVRFRVAHDLLAVEMGSSELEKLEELESMERLESEPDKAAPVLVRMAAFD